MEYLLSGYGNCERVWSIRSRQDLLVDAPSGNIRGAGPAVAEIEFELDPIKTNAVRPVESFMVLAADKCGPSAYTLSSQIQCIVLA